MALRTMDISLRELQSKVRNLALDARSLSRVMETDPFNRAWRVSSDAQKEQLCSLIAATNKRGVDRWIRSILAATCLEEKSVAELRATAKALGVSYVNIKTKEQLIVDIEEGSGEPGEVDGSGTTDRSSTRQSGDQAGTDCPHPRP